MCRAKPSPRHRQTRTIGPAPNCAARMTDDPPSTRIADIEVATLRAFCAQTTTETARRQALRELAEYVWREADHAVVYQAITRVGSRDLKIWRDELPAQTTRMGFPDLDWTIYLKPQGAVEPSLEELVGALKAAATS